ncbi:MAG: hypothetical protein ABUL60_29495 [Myxococcales bacterium]
MTDKKAKKARALKAKGWSLRDIAREIGTSHESVRTLLAAAPPAVPAHMAPLPKPRRPKSAKQAASGSLLDVCKEMLAELRRRARATSHPTLRTRYSADATNLAGLVLRLETQEAARVEGLAMTMAEVAEIQAGLARKIEAVIARAKAAGSLACTSCRAPLTAPLGSSESAPPKPPKRTRAAAPAATPAGADGMVAEARAALKWLLDSTADAEAVGDEMSTQRAGRAAVSIAGFVARLEKAIAKTRTDQIHVPAAAVDNAHAEIEERVSAIRNRTLMCSRCSRAHSVRLGTGLTEADLDAADGPHEAA